MLMVAFLATTAFAACGDDNDGDSGGSPVSGLIVSPTSLSFSKSGGKQTVSAQSAVQASATSSADWCVVTTGTQSANMKVTPISVTVDANPTTAERTAIITVTNKVISLRFLLMVIFSCLVIEFLLLNSNLWRCLS